MYFDAHVIEAAERKLDSRRWFGLSGEPVSGEGVARHLEAAADLMARQGWNWDPQLYRPFSGHAISDALRTAAMDSRGDEDTRYVAQDLLELLLRTRTGAPVADADAWGERPERALNEITDALAEAARLARRLGPQHAVR